LFNNFTRLLIYNLRSRYWA